MIAGLTSLVDNLLGRGEAAVTVPPLDGAWRPNRRLDEAAVRLSLPDVDSLTVAAGRLHASAGRALLALDDAGQWQPRQHLDHAIAALAPVGDDGLAVALADGEIVVVGGRWDGRRYRAGASWRCITALASHGSSLYVANGSTGVPTPDDWQIDLLRRGSSGSVWRLDLDSGATAEIASGLAYPAGLAVDEAGIVCAEAWRHRLVRLEPVAADPQVLCADLPGYPGRMGPAPDGWWLAVFAPRNQLVEFVLREPAYRERMLAEVPQPYWIAPKLRSGRSFYEPLQGGAVKQLGQLKPWAPTLSAGLCAALDHAFQPRSSMHSRADGRTHGVTSVAQWRGHLYVAARGDGVVVKIGSGSDPVGTP
jgi:hypothetical protein